jgi:hypothetical protein
MVKAILSRFFLCITVGSATCSGVTVRLSRVLQLREKLLSNEHPDTLTSISDLAVLYQFQGLYGKPCIKLVCTSSRILMENTVPA